MVAATHASCAAAAAAAASPFPAAARRATAHAGLAADRVRRALPRSLVRTHRRRFLVRFLRV